MEEHNSFASCMKIRGVSILPPLITSERRKELLEYKTKAVLLEQSYRRKRSQTSTSDMDFSKSVETEMTTMTSESDQSLLLENVLKEVGVEYVPYETRKKEKPNLSIDITNVYECIPLAEDKLNPHECESCYDENKKNNQNCTNELFESDIHKLDDPGRTRLIRSNSYTLDNPSSILLDHLKRQSPSLCDPTLLSDTNAEDVENLESSLPKLTKSMEFDSRNIQDLTSNISKMEMSNNSDKNSLKRLPSFEVITTDITVQQINFTTPDIHKENDTKELTKTIDQKSFGKEDEISSSTDPEYELKSILQQIPENYARKIMQLIEEQKIEQRRRTQNYEHLKTDLLQSGDFDSKSSIQISSPKRIFVTSASNPGPNPAIDKMLINDINKFNGRSESLDSHYTPMEKSVASSLNESQTLLFPMSTSSSDSLDDCSLRTFRMLEFDIHDDISKCQNQINPLISKKMILSKDGISTNYDWNEFKEREVRRMKEEKAASIIVAYAKGYLVRRLMNTAKVKTIIQSIQDALVCALELQKSETIEEADVELHRRLIKLVSSACFEFHDIFFALTIPEQMAIIATDRAKFEKALAVRKTQSSTDFRSRGRTSSNVRSSQSLTKI